MAVITVSGEPGCRAREVAQLAAQRLGYSHISAERLDTMMAEEFGPVIESHSKAWPDMAASILLRVASRTNLVVGVDGAELLFRSYPAVLRVRVVAPLPRRIGNSMLDDRLDRATARASLTERAAAIRAVRMARFGRATAAPETFDLTLNAETLDAAHQAELIEAAVGVRGLDRMGFLSAAAEAQLQFRIRLRLAAHGIRPGAPALLNKMQFGHPSEETFARLLDFYRIAWEYEPRSFPIKWDEQGRVLESFTPDFFLLESNLYVELTTMKQSLVTKKNRKIRLLREIYPHVNIQVFYQKDLQDLVLKYGLAVQAEKERVGGSMKTPAMPMIERVLFSEEEIRERVKAVAAEISERYKDGHLKLVGVLKGSVFFMTALARELTIPIKMDFLAISSFGDHSSAPGVVRISKDLDESIEGEDVLLVEDIVDTGFTARYLMQNLSGRGPNSIAICTMLDRTTRRIVPMQIDFRCFEIPDRFVIGCGLDYNQLYRNLNFIAVLKPDKA